MAVPARRLPERRRRGPRPPARRAASSRRPSPRRARRVPFLLFALVVVTATVLALASAQALVAQGSFRLAELSRQAEELQREQVRLRLKVARLSAPERVLRAARKAGLVLPQRVEIVAVRGPAAGAETPAGGPPWAVPGAGG